MSDEEVRVTMTRVPTQNLEHQPGWFEMQLYFKPNVPLEEKLDGDALALAIFKELQRQRPEIKDVMMNGLFIAEVMPPWYGATVKFEDPDKEN